MWRTYSAEKGREGTDGDTGQHTRGCQEVAGHGQHRPFVLRVREPLKSVTCCQEMPGPGLGGLPRCPHSLWRLPGPVLLLRWGSGRLQS